VEWYNHLAFGKKSGDFCLANWSPFLQFGGYTPKEKKDPLVGGFNRLNLESLPHGLGMNK